MFRTLEPPDGIFSGKLRDVLTVFRLHQHVAEATHVRCGLVDVIIARSEEQFQNIHCIVYCFIAL